MGDDAQKKLAVTHLTLLYMGHLRAAAGGAREFAEAFVLAGGLAALASVSTHANLHVRAQAVESLKLVLCGDDEGDDEVIHWYAEVRGAAAAARRQSALNERVLALADEATGFVSGLLANRAESYPGGGLACLNILAFWLSWARQQRCANRRLQLSRRLLEGLSDWARVAVDTAGERSLAVQLLDDFSRAGLDGPGDLELDDDMLAEVVEISDDGTFDMDTAPPAPPLPPRAPRRCPPPPPAARTAAARPRPRRANARARRARPRRRARDPAAATARERGNAAFARGALDEALEHYAAALAEARVTPSERARCA